jgi:hypothetical protein
MVNSLVKDHGLDHKAQANRKMNCMIIAAHNPKCKKATLQALKEMGLELNSECEIEASVLSYYVRNCEEIDHATVNWLVQNGNDPKKADKNKMNCLHYLMLNFHSTVNDIEYLVKNCGAPINEKMNQEIDLLDLVIYL